MQTVLKLTMPGVPDLYQGTELWDLTMVDPDNRRPVDFDHRTALLDQVLGDLERDRPGAMASYAEAWPDGRVKLALTASLLGLRRATSRCSPAADYEPVSAEGPGRDDVCAFTRRHDDDCDHGRGGAFSRPGATGRGWTQTPGSPCPRASGATS